MSGSDGSLIATTRNAELQALGTGGQLAVHAWDQISGYLRRARGPAHAALFAEPNPDPDRGITDWYATSRGDAPPLESLPQPAQDAARAEFTRLFNDVREDSETLRRSARENEKFLGELLALALITPATDCLRVADGQPVLIAWGHAQLGQAPSPELLIGMTARRGGAGPMRILGPPPPAAPPRRPWLAWLLGLLGLLALLLLLLLLWLDPFGWFKAMEPQCVIQPGSLEVQEELRSEQAREAALRADIAREMLRLGDRRTACPPPEPPPPPPRPTPPAPQPPPTPPTPPPTPRSADADRAQREGARTGRVQIILAWDDRNDLDLMLVCPSGERIYFDRRRACGAELDIDRNAGNSALSNTPVESIVFAGEPAHGRYRIMVWHFQNNPPAPASSPYRVTLKREGRPDQVFTGRVAAGQQIEVGHFDVP